MDDFISQVSHIGIQGLEDEWQCDSPPIPEEVQIDDSPIYIIERQLGRGGNGLVCAGRPIGPSTSSGQSGPEAAEVAVKFQRKHPSGSEADIPREWEVYDELGENHGIPLPRVHYKGQQGDYNILVMDLLGPSLHVRLIDNCPSLPLAAVACVAVEAISILEKLHSRGYIHGDVKPENFLLGRPGTPDERKLFLIDLGLAVRWQHHSSGSHARYHQSPNQFRGTLHFASVHAHLGRTSSRRDDLESLAYMLAFLIRGHLPWLGYEAEDSVCKKKMATPLEALCRSCPPPFLKFAEFAVNLRFDEDPNYTRYISLFRGIIGQNPYVWPVNVDAARESNEGDVLPESSLSRRGLRRSRWISIFHSHPPIRQRICYNVDNADLPLRIEEARADGMYVSSVANSHLDLWTVVMDSGTGFIDQVHTISPNFLPQGWIRRQWRRNYHITAAAGADNGSLLVIMSKGPRNFWQCYRVTDTFPYSWIKRKWALGSYVTAMATVGRSWVVVMSSAAGFVHQVVELDFQYPFEGIYERWNQGYFITSVAATPAQVALVFSIPEEEEEVPVRGSQEAVQTSHFPERVVTENWTRNYYVSLLSYGRTVS